VLCFEFIRYKYNPNSIDTLLLLRRAIVDLEWRLKKMEMDDMGTVGWKKRGPASIRGLFEE
jgi:hypothetical protein